MKGIMFQEPLFHLTVQGVKKQTRRIIKIEDCSSTHKEYFGAEWMDEPMKIISGIHASIRGLFDWDGSFYCEYCGNGDGQLKPRYKVGETLYLKEPYYVWDEWDQEDGQTSYKFDNPEKMVPFWENKLFMPEKYARHFIKITNVKAERLQNISDEDCEKEGISPMWNNGFVVGWSNKSDGKTYTTRKEAYAALIDSINGVGTWDGNPFVWVYDYELTGKEMEDMP